MIPGFNHILTESNIGINWLILSLFLSLSMGTETVSCLCEEHVGRELINSSFNLSVQRLWTVLFTRSEAIQKFWTFRKMLNVQMSQWLQKKQQMEYSTDLGPFGTCRNYEELVKKKFIFWKFCQKFPIFLIKKILREKENEFVVVETEAFTYGIMYAEYFTVINRFCITRRAANRSHLLIKTFIKYKKQPNFIAKSAELY